MARGEPGRAERVGQDLLDLLDELRAGRAEPMAPVRRNRFSAATLAIGVLIGVLGAMLFVPDDSKEAAPVAASTGAGTLVTGDAGTTSSPSGSTNTVPVGSPPVVGGGTTGGAAMASGSTSSSAGTAAPAGPPPAAAAGTATPTANVRGVTASKIKIGVTVLTGGEALTGPLEQSYRAVFDGFRKSGQLPVHGRDVDLVFRNFSLTGNESELRAACVQLAQEDKIFAGIIWLIAPVNECLAREFKIPSITGYLDTETMRRTMPYVFATAADLSAQIRNVPHWAHANNLIKGKKLGLYYRDSDVMKKAIEQLFKPQLKALGYELAAEVAADGSASSPALAVQRFRAAGVDTIFLQARPWDFGQAAEAQAYRPQYLLFSAENNAQADGIASYAGALPQQFDKAWSVTANRFGESGANGNPAPVGGRREVPGELRALHGPQGAAERRHRAAGGRVAGDPARLRPGDRTDGGAEGGRSQPHRGQPDPCARNERAWAAVGRGGRHHVQSRRPLRRPRAEDEPVRRRVHLLAAPVGLPAVLGLTL